MSELSYLIDPSWGIAGFIDVETTGLNSEKDEIIEFSIVLFAFDQKTGEIKGIVDEYTGLREPERRIPKAASEIHGITRKDVKGRVLDNQKINPMIRRADFLVSHNAAFDSSFVQNHFGRYEKPWLCSMDGIDWKAKGFRSKALQKLLKDHNIAVDEAHRAEADVKACLTLLSQKDSEGQYYFKELLKHREVAATLETMTNDQCKTKKSHRSFGWVKAILFFTSLIILPFSPWLGVTGVIASLIIKKNNRNNYRR